MYFDITGDGGAGSPKYSESTATDRYTTPRITADGKNMITRIYGSTVTGIVYRVVDLTAKTSTDKVIMPTEDPKYYSYNLSLGTDNDKMLLVAGGSASRSFIYSISQNKIINQFDNVNKDVSTGYLF